MKVRLCGDISVALPVDSDLSSPAELAASAGVFPPAMIRLQEVCSELLGPISSFPCDRDLAGYLVSEFLPLSTGGVTLICSQSVFNCMSAPQCFIDCLASRSVGTSPSRSCPVNFSKRCLSCYVNFLKTRQDIDKRQWLRELLPVMSTSTQLEGAFVCDVLIGFTVRRLPEEHATLRS